MRTADLKPKEPKKQTISPNKYASWDEYVQAKVDRANDRLTRMDLTKLVDKQKLAK